MPRSPRFTEEEARRAIAASLSYTEVLRRLGMRPAGGNHRTIRKYAEEIWHIPVAHFDPHAASRASLRHEPIPLEQVLVTGSRYSRRSLKLRLYAAGLKRRSCEMCGQGEEWRGKAMSLILDHENGIADDNRIENLRILCPNCAATLETHCGKNLARTTPCARCGSRFRPRSPTQRHCSQTCAATSEANQAAHVAARRVERPPYEQLMREIEAAGYVATGRRYGVSDNAVRKWVRQYERDIAEASNSGAQGK